MRTIRVCYNDNILLEIGDYLDNLLGDNHKTVILIVFLTTFRKPFVFMCMEKLFFVVEALFCGQGQRHDISTGMHTCEACPAGYHQPAFDHEINDCIPCGYGESASGGASSCSQCSPGYYAPNTANTQCYQCNIGQYASGIGSRFCDTCPAGKYSPILGSTGCSSCPIGWYSTEEASSCTPCSPGTFSATQESGGFLFSISLVIQCNSWVRLGPFSIVMSFRTIMILSG